MFKLTCDAFRDGGVIPELHLGPGHGDNIAPTLTWSGTPEQTRAYALEMTDDDAPGYCHWVMLVDGAADRVDPSSVRRSNVYGKGTRFHGYEGPCPPEGQHHYRLTLYALAERPRLDPGFDADQLHAAIEGLVLDTAELTATHNAGLGRSLQVQGGRVISFLRRQLGSTQQMAA